MNPFCNLGLVRGGFFAFIENGHLIADEDLFALFGLRDLKRVDCKDLIGIGSLPARSGGPVHSILATDRWKMIGDGYYYQLYRRPDTKHVLRELSRSHGTVFAFMVSDMDAFHEFRLLRDGAVVREYITEGDFFSAKPHAVVIDSGARLEGELDEAPQDHTLSPYLFTLATGQGFDITDGLALAPRAWTGPRGTDLRVLNRSKFPDPEAWF